MGHRWYIIHAHSGFEQKAAQEIRKRAGQKDLEAKFEELVVPTENVVELKKGKRVNVERKFFPGYILAKMEMNEETWQLVKNTPRISGFLGGGGNKPMPVSQAEVDAIIKQIEDGVESPKNAVTYAVGDEVKVIDGPFNTFVGSVVEVDDASDKLKVEISIFGRATPVDLSFSQVEKN